MGHAHVEDKPNVSSNSAMWFGLLLIVLIISAVNFVKVSSGGHGHDVAHADAHATHDAAHDTEHNKAATTTPATTEATGADSAAH